MAITYGYARCSTNESRQDVGRQKRDLKTLGVENDQYIYFEYASGAKKDRPEFQKLLAAVQPGDTIAATEVSRISRSTQQLCEMIQLVQERHLRLIIGGFVVDCRERTIDPMTKGMLMMWSVFAEMERDIITDRIRSGVENAKAKGVRFGRPQMTVDEIPPKFWKYYAMYQNDKISLSELARLMGSARTTIYRYIALAGGVPKHKKGKD